MPTLRGIGEGNGPFQGFAIVPGHPLRGRSRHFLSMTLQLGQVVEGVGVTQGGRPGWNQEWRKPLREARDWLRDTLAPKLRSMNSGGELTDILCQVDC